MQWNDPKRLRRPTKGAKASLAPAKFRWLNEMLYCNDSLFSQKMFQDAPELFEDYHSGFANQTTLWPVNPLDIIIENLRKYIEDRPKIFARPPVFADLGCGEARIHDVFSELAVVHSFDLVSTKPHVQACDISKVPCVFCVFQSLYMTTR